MEVRKIEELGLSRLEGEGGYWRFITNFSEHDSGCIYYLVTQDEFSSIHKLSCDEMWILLAGAECEQHVFNEESGEKEIRVLSPAHRDSLVKAGFWQSTKLKRGEWALFCTVMCPHYTDGMYTSPSEALFDEYPFLKEYRV